MGIEGFEYTTVEVGGSRYVPGLAVFDLLTRPGPDLTADEGQQVMRVAEELLAVLKRQKLVLDWRRNSAREPRAGWPSRKSWTAYRSSTHVRSTHRGVMPCSSTWSSRISTERDRRCSDPCALVATLPFPGDTARRCPRRTSPPCSLPPRLQMTPPRSTSVSGSLGSSIPRLSWSRGRALLIFKESSTESSKPGSSTLDGHPPGTSGAGRSRRRGSMGVWWARVP